MPTRFGRAAALLLLSLSAAACGSRSNGATGTSPADVQLASAAARVGEPFQLKLGQSADVAGTGLRLTFRRVAADSRCPINAMCVWAGDAEIAVAVERNGAAGGTVELHTNPPHNTGGLREVDYDGRHVIRLEDVTPVPIAGQEEWKKSYAATLVVRVK